MTSEARAPGLAVLGALLVSSAGCPSDPGLPYDTLSVAASTPSGAQMSGFPKCITLPILHGSVVEEEHPIQAPLAVHVLATDSAIDVTFRGATNPPSRHVTLEQLDSSFSEALDVTSQSGQAFLVTLTAGCP